MKHTYLKYALFILLIALGSLIFYADSIKLSTFQDQKQLVKAEFFLVWAGIFSYALMTFNLVLATRFTIISNFFNGLDKVYFVHKFNGYLILVFTFLHFVKSGTLNNQLGVASKLASDTFSSTNKFEGFLQDEADLAGELVFWLIVSLIIFSVLKRIGNVQLLPYGKWKISHKLFIVVFLTVTFHMLFIKRPFAGGTKIDHFLVICGTIGCLSLFWTQIRKFFVRKKYQIVEIERLKDTTKIVIEAQTVRYSRCRPGQFAFISFRKIPELSEPHPFTIAICEGGGRKLTFYIKACGDFTKSIFDKAAFSDEIFVDGPHGNFLPNYTTNASMLWVAGGVGITPFLSFASSFKELEKAPISLLYVVRDQDDLIGLDRLQAAQKTNPNFIYHVVVTSQEGRPSYDTIASAFPELRKAVDLYFCGPEALRKSIIKILKDSGARVNKIKYEVFTFR